MEELLDTIIRNPQLHARFINTLSYLENCGARKIARCEHPTLVKEEILKHAAEEFRHAHYLKRQIRRVSNELINDYTLPFLLGGYATIFYLHRLDALICRHLKRGAHCNEREITQRAYLLVSYAIEVRAESFYPFYHQILKKQKSPITVRSIIVEESEHLEEMKRGILKFDPQFSLAKEAVKLEEGLFQQWIASLRKEV